MIVANRLPVVRADDGSWEVSPGGLVSALAPIVQAGRGSWIGWAGTIGTPPKAFDHGGMRLTPLGLSAREIEGFYEGFANGTLWPLYHDAIRPPEFQREWWQSYVETNERFADAAARWPRRARPCGCTTTSCSSCRRCCARCGPTCASASSSTSPSRRRSCSCGCRGASSSCEGMLGADLVGFQRPVAAQNFAAVCRRLVDVSPTRSPIPYERAHGEGGRVPGLHRFRRVRRDRRASRRREGRRRAAGGLGSPRRILLGVDRLDYTKGIDVRLQAFRELLNERRHDSAARRCSCRSRPRVASASTTYRQLRERVERAVGRINGEFGRLGHPAIHYQHHNLPREDLCALYVAADVMLVTPLRDGMNLVCKEYVASRHRGGGALVLSEFAGAAGELRQALLVNPHDVVGLRETIARAIALPEGEARRRMREMRRQVRTHDVHRFARSFLEALAEPTA